MIPLEPPSGMDGRELACFVCKTLRSVDWDDTAATFLSAMRELLAQLLVVVPSRVKPVRENYSPLIDPVPPWTPYCLFALVLPDWVAKPWRERWTYINGWATAWLGRNTGDWKGRSGAFDADLATETEYRVRRPGSGQTRKPGSHMDNTGHR